MYIVKAYFVHLKKLKKIFPYFLKLPLSDLHFVESKKLCPDLDSISFSRLPYKKYATKKEVLAAIARHNDCKTTWTEKTGTYLKGYTSVGKKTYPDIDSAKNVCKMLEPNGIIIYYKNWQGITFPKVALYNIKAGYLKFKFLDCGGITYSDKHKSYRLRKRRTPYTPKTPTLETSWLRPVYCENGETNHLHPVCLSRAI